MNTSPHSRRGAIALLVSTLLFVASPLGAQDTAQVRAITTRQKTLADSIAKRSTSPTIDRQAARMKRLADSITVAAQIRRDSLPPQPMPQTARIELKPSTGTLAVGQALTFIALPKDASGANISAAVSWSASPSTVGTISGLGVLTAKVAGTVVVTARADTASRSATITVTDTAVVIKPDTISPPPPPTGSVAELPRVTPAPVYPSCARTTTLTMVSSLQAALDAAAFGDCIALPAGSTYTGNFVWPVKPGTGYVQVFTATTAPMPPPGTRMTPSKCAQLQCAKILSPSYTEAIGTAPGAHGLILRGVEVSTTPAVTTMNVLVRLSDPGQQDEALVPYDIIIDRSYLHGRATLDSRRCVLTNSRTTIVIDSWLDECHSNNSDSQAIIGYSGTRGLLVKNNHLAAGHEIVFLGGADPLSLALSPSDITIVGNYITHPVSWYKVWQVKNCIETKNARRLLVEGNVIENCWVDAQAGFAIVMKSENQNGGAPWTTTSDVTIQYNLIRNVSSGFNISGSGSNGTPNITSARFDIHDNLITGFCPAQWDTQSCIPFQFLTGLTDATVRRNTVRNDARTGMAISFDGAPTVRLTLTGLAMHAGQYGVKGTGTGVGTPALAVYAPGGTFANNVLVGADCSVYPATTQCPASWPTLPTATAGADTVRIMAATAGAVVVDGTPSAFTARSAIAQPAKIPYPHPTTPPACQRPTAVCADPPLRLR